MFFQASRLELAFPFHEIVNEVAKAILLGAKESSDSDMGDRMESVFNISFWAKEGAIDWKRLGLDTSKKERTADALTLAFEWECFRVSERDLIDCLLDSPWPCSMAVLRILQMCEPNDISELQMPEKCPWCGASVTVSESSLCMQIWNYACHMTTAKACVHTKTGILKENEVKEQAFPTTRDLLSARRGQRSFALTSRLYTFLQRSTGVAIDC